MRIIGLLAPSFVDVTRPLKDASFRRLWLATFAWNFARWMELTITGWVAFQLTGSPWLVALIGVFRSAFLPLAGPITGALSDRFDRVGLMKVAQWGNVLVIGAVALALLAGAGAYWQLVLAALWLGASWGIDWPVRRALLADMVGPERLVPAVVLDNWTQNISRVAGPILAGLLLALWGGPGAFTALALSFLLASVTLMPLRPSERLSGPASRSVWGELMAGLSYVRQDPAVWAVLVVTVLMNCLLFPYQQLLSVFAEDVLRAGPVGLGTMGAAGGVGAVLALLFLPSLRHVRRQAWAFTGGSCLACVALVSFALSESFPLSTVLLVIIGLGTSAFGTMQSTIILSRAAPEMRGRVMGLLAMAIGSAPLGALELGLLVERLGAPLAVAVNATLCGLLVALVAWRTGLAGPRQHASTLPRHASVEAPPPRAMTPPLPSGEREQGGEGG
ncbi:MAG TPA: MFS transporter [Chloroflexota bacterium]|nr:MFS transporter [Chloroflexota bacterium]